ncbi:MAG: beta-galactosidase [Pseudomonadota bacterium]
MGVCYYPEHWPEVMWPEDARRMADMGLTWVRIGEFAWSRLEPSPGEFRFDWLDRAVDVLAEAGLKIVLGTPSATPPRWMLDRYPDLCPVTPEGRVLGFGSRRHYCFSHGGYRADAAEMAGRLADRYGRHAALGAWQIDNEYGCHGHARSFSPAAAAAFVAWLERRYGHIEALNAAWGNVFWSMEYGDFAQIDLPRPTVTECNPAHELDFRRFVSDEVAAFNQAQVDAIAPLSDAPISHNYMGRITDFDHFELGAQMQIATWDSYPLGFLEDRVPADEAHRARYARQGDPDFQAFHHDLYRAVGRGRWWVMEQQPGPVNWAPSNPEPLPGMVRLWSWEAFAHGAEAVCYFRWRQAPFGQEQMHTGLNRPDDVPAPGAAEAAQVAREIAEHSQIEASAARVAIIFDYASLWSWEVQPQGQGCDYFELIFELYRALRAKGQSIDIVPADCEDFSRYALVFAPGLEIAPDGLLARLETSGVVRCLGPRFGSKTPHCAIPEGMPPVPRPGDLKVVRVESLRPGMTVPLEGGGAVGRWRETVEGAGTPQIRDEDGRAVLCRVAGHYYLAAWPDQAGWARVLDILAEAAGLTLCEMPDGVRLRDTVAARYVFNYTAEAVDFDGETISGADLLRRPLSS